MHTVHQLAALAGVTVRTLHHYDSLGLLKPTQVGANGYRYYDREALVRLQQILLYRELGLGLAEVGRLLGPGGPRVAEALVGHRKALQTQIARLTRLVETVDRTLAAEKGERTMTDAELFEGLSPQERAYAHEAATRWDPATVKESNRRWARLTKGQQEVRKAADHQLRVDWARLIGTDPASAPARALVARWRQGIEFFYPTTPEGLMGLAQLYQDDPRFRAVYDAVDPRLAEFVGDCVRAAFGKD